MPLEKDSEKCLLSVKDSGKPCYFVLVKKSNEVTGLVASRKGTPDSRKQMARNQVSGGELSWGVVEGKGANLSFKLLSTDGFNDTPIKDSKLRSFLEASHKSFKGSKAKMEVVNALPDVTDEDQQQPQIQPTQTTTTTTTTTTTQSPLAKLRSADDWKVVIAAIQSETNGPTKMQMLLQAKNECQADTAVVQQVLQTTPNSDEAQKKSVSLGKVKGILDKLTPQLPQAPLNPTLQKLQGLRSERDGVQNELQTVKAKVGEKRHLLNETSIAAMLQDCETDANSDFGQICSLLDLGLMTKPKGKAKPKDVSSIDGKYVDTVMSKLIQAKQKSLAYVKEHKDPLVGSLPTRVKKRKQNCDQFVKQIDDYIVFIGNKNEAALDLCKKYGQKAQAGQYVPPEVAVELRNLLNEPLLTDETKYEIRKTIDLIATESQKPGFDLLRQRPNMPTKERLEVMEAYGCGSKPSGGTSDVKLLKGSPTGGIEFALKSSAQESEQALEQLGLPNGACAIREDVSSIIFEKFKELTQIDLGFPKSEVAQVNGQTYAVIEGISGKMADKEGVADIKREIEAAQALREKLVKRQRPPEEIQDVDTLLLKLQNKLAGAEQDMEAVPDTVTSESMGKVLMSSILSCQWDCKWGNLIVDNGNARPIDAGAALPTLNSLDGFLTPDHKGTFGVPALEQLLMYPGGHSKAYTDLPIANQNIDQNMVTEMLKLDPDVMVQAAKDRRDKVLQDNPDLGDGTPLLEDLSFDAMKDSINGAKQILQSKQPMTLKEFVQAWTKWFENWAPGFYQSHEPKTGT